MSVAWTLNDQTFASLGVDDGTLSLVNLGADVLTLTQTLDSAQLPAAPFSVGAEVTLKRGTAVWFRGRLREIDESVDRARTLRIRGAWDVLERKAYLQNFKAALDPSDPLSALGNILRGRVVLGQNDDGDRVNLAGFLSSVISYAGLTPGTIDTTLTVPFEDATDLSCADVLERMLRWIPNAVVWFDYSTNPATCHIRQRANLTAVSLAVTACDEPLRLRPRHDLVVNNVALFYVATNRSNDASWETLETDVHPPGTTGQEDGALVRTIELAGSIATSSYLTQKVETDEIPAALTDASLSSGWVKSGPVFSSVRTWWRNHRPELKKSNITIVAFRSGSRQKADESAITPNLRELISGGLTDWMVEDDASLINEEQIVEVDIAYKITSGSGSSATEQQVIERLSAQIQATNAQSKTYRQLADSSFTAGEEAPSGLALALYNALNPLMWEGEVQVTEDEATDLARPGQVLNITGGAAAWATMAAVVQRRDTELGVGRTTIRLGPPPSVSAAGLVEIYRQNRNRRPSTSYLVRVSGQTGGSGGSTLAAPLPVAQPIRPAQASTRVVPRVFTQALSVAGVVPTTGEVTTALQTIFTAANPPVSGDIVNLTVSGTVKLRATVSAHGASAGLFGVSFVVDGVTFWAHVVQTGLY